MENTPQDTQLLLKTFKPTKIEMVVLASASLLFLLVNSGMSYIKTADGKSYSQATEIIEANLREGLRVIDYIAGNTILTMLFWMFIGLIVYTISWFIIETYKAYHDDIPVTKGMIFPKGYKKSKAIHETIARFSTRLVSSVLLSVWAYIFLAKVLPYSSGTFSDNLQTFSITGVLSIIWAVLIVSVSVFAIFVLTRCALLRNRVFTS